MHNVPSPWDCLHLILFPWDYLVPIFMSFLQRIGKFEKSTSAKVHYLVFMVQPCFALISCSTRGRLVTMPEPRGRKSLKKNNQNFSLNKKTAILSHSKIQGHFSTARHSKAGSKQNVFTLHLGTRKDTFHIWRLQCRATKIKRV